MQNVCFQDKIEWWMLNLMEQVQLKARMSLKNLLLEMIFYFCGAYYISSSLLYTMTLMIPIWRNWDKHSRNPNITFLRRQPSSVVYLSDTPK